MKIEEIKSWQKNPLYHVNVKTLYLQVEVQENNHFTIARLEEGMFDVVI
jgi:hypothetical protein